jgi:hypothetical protein
MKKIFVTGLQADFDPEKLKERMRSAIRSNAALIEDAMDGIARIKHSTA